VQLLKKENEREKLARSKLSADDPNYIESSASSEPTRSLGDSSKAQEGGVAALNDDELNEIEEVYQAIEDVSQSLLGAMDDRSGSVSQEMKTFNIPSFCENANAVHLTSMCPLQNPLKSQIHQ
jgi:hypothetical protein